MQTQSKKLLKHFVYLILQVFTHEFFPNVYLVFELFYINIIIFLFDLFLGQGVISANDLRSVLRDMGDIPMNDQEVI
jgi:hypothetical protein